MAATTTTEDGPPFNVFLAGLYQRLLSPDFVANLVKVNKLDDMLFQRSKNVLFSFEDVSDAAEDKQLQDPAVKKWLDPIKDAFYVADDLLNQIATKSEPVEEVSMLKGIIHRLESILEHKDLFGLKQLSSVDLSYRTPTSLVEGHDIIYGRDADKEAIMELLLKDNSDANISVIPILGMGGVGKTTLAQMVYNDHNLKQNFDLKAWVCIPEDFDILKVTKNIIEAFTSNTCNMKDLSLLQLHLKEKLSGKNFLVVLDGFQNESYADWEILQSPFQNGMKRSKILVTTRTRKVASSLVQTGGEVYELMQLSDEDCCLLFAKRASLSSRFSTNSTREKIGREIVNKCKGLPLAVQIIGGLLQTKHNIKDRNNILKSDIWKLSENESDIIPALAISYNYLPAHLKRCFVSCSSYPKDYKFNKDELVSFWMAQGLLQPSNSEKT